MVVVASGVCDHPNAPAARTIRKRKKVLRNAPFAVMCETRVVGGGAPVASAWASATGAAQPASSSFSICSKRFGLSAGLAMVSSLSCCDGSLQRTAAHRRGAVRADPHATSDIPWPRFRRLVRVRECAPAGSSLASSRPLGLFAPVLADAPDVARAASTCSAHAFVANSGDGNVSVIDVATDTVVGSPFVVGGGPSGVATSPDGQKVYVTDDGGTTMKVLDATSGSVLATVDVGGSPVSVAVSPDGHTAYVTNFFLGTTVTVVDLDTDTADGTITVGSGPSDVAFTPDGAHAYVTNFDGTTVSVIDTATRTVGRRSRSTPTRSRWR